MCIRDRYKEIDGEQRLSIFREYALGVTEGLKAYYIQMRSSQPEVSNSEENE